MDHSKFRIGQEFWFCDRQWRCTDVGQRVVVAIRIDEVTSCSFDTETESEVKRTMTGADAEREGWFKGPPYAVLESVLDEYDFEGCTLTREEQ